MKTNYEQIVDVAKIGQHSAADMNAIFTMAEQERFPASVDDSPKRLLLAIDVQNDFIEGGALAVPGSMLNLNVAAGTASPASMIRHFLNLQTSAAPFTAVYVVLATAGTDIMTVIKPAVKSPISFLSLILTPPFLSLPDGLNGRIVY